MKLTKYSLERIISNVGPSPDAIAEAINQIDYTIREVDRLKDEISDINLAAELETEKIKSHIRDIQDKCKHYERRYNPDPSGGSDSYTECLICGKQL